MFTYNFCTISLLFLSCITQITYAYNNQQQSCFAYPLVEIAPNKTVHFVTSFKGNYFEASNYCRKHCMHLVTIDSQIEQEGIENYIKNTSYKNENFWTSGNDLGQEGTFIWSSNGETLTYTNWYELQPDNGVVGCESENCLHIWSEHNYKWNDLRCSIKCYFICEVQSEYYTNSYKPS